LYTINPKDVALVLLWSTGLSLFVGRAVYSVLYGVDFVSTVQYSTTAGIWKSCGRFAIINFIWAKNIAHAFFFSLFTERFHALKNIGETQFEMTPITTSHQTNHDACSTLI